MANPEKINQLTDTWRTLIKNGPAWVMFSHGTCVGIINPVSNTPEAISAEALEIMKRDGPVYIGSPHADMVISKAEDLNGWIVTGHNPNILTFVSEKDAPDNGGLGTCVMGRNIRKEDAAELNVVHVETKQ